MHTQPSPDEWRSLQRAAIALADADPWNVVDPDEAIAVENPETGEIGFIIVSPDVFGGERGVMVAFDATSLYYFAGLGSDEVARYNDFELRQNYVLVGYTDFDELDDEEREELTSLGEPVPYENVPAFLRVQPACVPTAIDAAATRFTTLALELAAELLPRYDQLPDEPPVDDLRLVHVLRDGRWTEEWRPANDVESMRFEAPPKRRPVWDELAVHVEQQEIEWEFGAMLLPSPIDPDGGPELACAHMICEGEMTLATITEAHRDAEGLCDFLVDAIREHGMRPRSIVVAEPMLASALTELVATLDITLNVVPYLPTIGPVYGELMEKQFAEDDDEENDFDRISLN